MTAITQCARHMIRGLHPGRKLAYLRAGGRTLAGPLHTVKAVKRAKAGLAAAGISTTVAVATFD